MAVPAVDLQLARVVAVAEQDRLADRRGDIASTIGER